MGIFSKKKEEKKPVAAKAEAKADEKKAAAPATETSVKSEPRDTKDAHRVLVRPIVTEKTTAQASKSQYAFEVAPDANKLEVRKAVALVYGVTATDVRILNVRGKFVRSRNGYGRRADWRKAVVTLKKGDAIELFAKA